ncbi:MAG: DUF2807 domain-containing protein [Bacteroidetes bacterium]|nr:MAG: DUF2807 domain-containing protein [Bacteroidota bacterium]
MRNILATIAVLTFTLSSCHSWFGEHIDGNGNITKENRSVSGFNGIDVSGGIDVIVRQDSTESVKVEIDANLQEYIITKVENGVLEIHQVNNTNLNASSGIKVYVSGKNFKSFEASGACDIIGENKIENTSEISFHATGASKIELDLKAPKISGDLTGASDLRLAGETKDLYINASGASNARCFELMTENADVDLSGASTADVFASVSVKGEATGASNVTYKGSASSVVVSTSGAGSVNKTN